MRRARSAFAAACLSLVALLAIAVAPATATAPVATVEPVNAAYTTAIAKGTLNPQDKATTYHFEYVTKGDFEATGWDEALSTAKQSLLAGAGVKAVDAQLSGLTPSTDYNLRLLAANADGEVEALAPVFVTKAVAKPTISALSVDDVDADSAHFSFSVNPNAPAAAPIGEPLLEGAYVTTWELACEPAPACPQLGGSVPADNKATSIEVDAKDATRLQANLDYEIMLVAKNAGGEVKSAPVSFKTDAAPPGLTRIANAALGPGEVGLGVFLNANNATIDDCHFEYGPDEGYGSSVPCDPASPAGGVPMLVRGVLAGLSPGAAYHVRLQVSGSEGAAVGDDVVVEAPPLPASPGCATSAAPGATFLPGCRAWEMVSPRDKNGGYVVPDSRRTRAAVDGSAVGFLSLAGFGDAVGAGIATDYISERSTDPDPGHNGWSTHAVTPFQDPQHLLGVLLGLDPRYQGEFSPDLGRGVFLARSPLTADPGVENVINIYRRTDLRTPGVGTYQLLSACPFCAVTETQLPPLTGTGTDLKLSPELAGSSPNLDLLAFESRQRLTEDAPFPNGEQVRLYEWENGAVRLAGRVPSGSAISCDDDEGPACVTAGVSQAGVGDVRAKLAPHVVSDGSDGHVRIFFSVPTNAGGGPVLEGMAGNLYARVDGTETVKLNASERTPAAAFAPAQYLDANPEGTRVLFMSAEALTDDAPVGTQQKLYMYDTTKAVSAPDNLTFLSKDGEPNDGANVAGAIGIGGGEDPYVYFIDNAQLVDGEPLLTSEPQGIYLWHAGGLRFIGRASDSGASGELLSTGVDLSLFARQARVTPDGARLLFSAIDGKGLLSRYGGVDYDHGVCESFFNAGCRELYLYGADTDDLQCVSCKPAGGPSTTVKGAVPEEMTATVTRELSGGTQTSTHQTHALSDDGRYAFFSTAQKLVAKDTNGTIDAYVYDSTAEEPRLLSSGEDSGPSWFMDATPNGSDAFILTKEKLSGWDVGNDYDLYDARVGGGFPEPPPSPPSCVGDACQPAPLDLNDQTPGSASVSGPGNQSAAGNRRARCPKGKRRVKARNGKSRCVKQKQRSKRAKRNGRAGR